MSRANTIFGVIALAFIVYITVKGQLPAYAAIFTPKPKPKATPTSIVKSALGDVDPSDIATVAQFFI